VSSPPHPPTGPLITYKVQTDSLEFLQYVILRKQTNKHTYMLNDPTEVQTLSPAPSTMLHFVFQYLLLWEEDRKTKSFWIEFKIL